MAPSLVSEEAREQSETELEMLAVEDPDGPNNATSLPRSVLISKASVLLSFSLCRAFITPAEKALAAHVPTSRPAMSLGAVVTKALFLSPGKL